MRGWLLDTNVVSELRKPGPHSRIIDFIGMQPGATLFVSEVTLGEIRYGIETLGDASIIPTRPGDYTFHFIGTISGQKVDDQFTSSDKTFDPANDPASVPIRCDFSPFRSARDRTSGPPLRRTGQDCLA